MENKSSLELATSRSSGYKISSENSLLVMYFLTKFDEPVVELFQKSHLLIHASQFMTS